MKHSTTNKISNLLKEISEVKSLHIETPVVIYGAGNTGRKAQRILQELGYSVFGFLDQNCKHTVVEGLPCVLPDSSESSAWQSSGATVVVAVMNPEADTREIKQSLSHFPWTRVIPFPQFVELFHDQWGDHYWITHRDLYKDINVQRVILHTTERWEDQASRDCFRTILAARLNGQTDELDDLVRKNQLTQYFPEDIPGWPTPTNFIDCGAFDGDTLREIPMQTLQSIAAFEPDTENFLALVSSTQTSSAFKEKDVKVFLWPCGVWNESTTLRFKAEQTTSSHLDVNGENIIQAVALDDVLHGFSPDFIKMDIEGAELQALQGARLLIEEHHPALAICVYHKPEHLWEILRLIDSWDCGYQFYLRAQLFSGLEIVLYAISTTP